MPTTYRISSQLLNTRKQLGWRLCTLLGNENLWGHTWRDCFSAYLRKWLEVFNQNRSDTWQTCIIITWSKWCAQGLLLIELSHKISFTFLPVNGCLHPTPLENLLLYRHVVELYVVKEPISLVLFIHWSLPICSSLKFYFGIYMQCCLIKTLIGATRCKENKWNVKCQETFATRPCLPMLGFVATNRLRTGISLFHRALHNWGLMFSFTNHILSGAHDLCD